MRKGKIFMEDKNREVISKNGILFQLKKITKVFQKLWQKEELRYRVLILMGLAGMGLILISGMGKPSLESGEDISLKKESSTDEYIFSTEERLQDIIRQIENVGECSVMLTVEQGRETVYASEGKTSQQVRQDDFSKNSDSETKLVLLKNREGSVPLVEKTVEPRIKGVIVVCRGAKSASVRQQVTEAVTTVLGIRSTQVWVCPRSRFK